MRRGLGTELRMVGGADSAEERSRWREEPVQRPQTAVSWTGLQNSKDVLDLWMGNSEPRGGGLRSGEREAVRHGALRRSLNFVRGE